MPNRCFYGGSELVHCSTLKGPSPIKTAPLRVYRKYVWFFPLLAITGSSTPGNAQLSTLQCNYVACGQAWCSQIPNTLRSTHPSPCESMTNLRYPT